jgi:hypothetical protein
MHKVQYSTYMEEERACVNEPGARSVRARSAAKTPHPIYIGSLFIQQFSIAFIWTY